MQWSDEVRIDTPEQVGVDLEVAGLGSRFVAQLLDWLIKWGLLAVVTLVAVILFALGWWFSSQNGRKRVPGNA